MRFSVNCLTLCCTADAPAAVLPLLRPQIPAFAQRPRPRPLSLPFCFGAGLLSPKLSEEKLIRLLLPVFFPLSRPRTAPILPLFGAGLLLVSSSSEQT